MQAAGRGKPRSPSAAFATLAAVVLAALALAAPASAAPPAIGGFSGGHSEPIPPGAPRIPYSADFLKGSPTVKGLRLRELVGGPRAGRLRVRVAVNYPELRQRPTGLLSDRASYDGRVIVVFKRVGFDVRERETQAVPLGARRQGGRVVQRAVLSARASRVLQADGGRIAARVRAIGSFDQFGDGQAEERAAGQLRRSVRIGQAHRRPGSGDETAFACAGDADLNAYKPGREPFFDAHLIYQGQEDVFFDQPSLRIRLCVWSGRPLDQFRYFDWDTGSHGDLSAPQVKDGYVTATYTPDPGLNGGPPDLVEVGLRGYPNNGPKTPYDVFRIRILFRPFEMRAMGDSITAGWGYLGNGDPPQLSGSDQDFDFPVMELCSPEGDSYSNRCSSNSKGGPDEPDVGNRFSADTGLANNVAWPAQFANRHGIGFRSSVGVFQTYGNYAVSGARPEHWVQGGRLDQVFDERILQYTPDLTVMTLGANPILANMITDTSLQTKCGGVSDPGGVWHDWEDATKCMQDMLKREDVYGRLRAVYRRLLAIPNNHIFVAKYPLAYPSFAWYVITSRFTNEFDPWVIERMVNVLNDEIARAVHDEAEYARTHGMGDRLFIFSPPRFKLGLPGYAQIYGGDPGVTCPTDSSHTRIDGMSNQSAATQKAIPYICRTNNTSDYWFESLDTGLHLSKTGATQYANALDSALKEHGVKLP